MQDICEAINYAIQHNHIPVEVETDNLIVSMAINSELNQEW